MLRRRIDDYIALSQLQNKNQSLKGTDNDWKNLLLFDFCLNLDQNQRVQATKY